jgi:hypothetical protein
MLMATLPAEFADLEPFADWALPSELDRYGKRVVTSMADLQAFYDAAFPRLEGGTEYLKGVSLEGISDEDRNLLWLFSSLPAPGAGQRRIQHRRRCRTGAVGRLEERGRPKPMRSRAPGADLNRWWESTRPPDPASIRPGER